MKAQSILFYIPIALFFVGCGTKSSTYVDSQGPEAMVLGNQITITDFYIAADEMVNSMITSGVIDRAPRQPAVLGISRVVNDTREQFDTDQLVKKIRVALNQTGKVVTTTTVGLGGRVEDPLADSIRDKEVFLKGRDAVTDNTPDFTLSGKIIQPPLLSEGRKRQNSYIFQLTLSDTKAGLAVWEDEKTITKQYKRSAVNW